MAGEGQGYQGIELPSLFGSPGAALQNAIGVKQRQQERGDNLAFRQEEKDYRRSQDVLRQQDKDEMDLYRKVQMLREYTDLSKHQTGNAIADDIGNRKVADVVGKWTGLLQQKKDLSYADLLSGVNKDVSGLVGSLDAMKKELNESDEAIKLIKQQFPEADANRLMQEFRADILNRRIANNNDFVNPLQVAPSQFANNLTNPDFLSRYITGNKNLAESIINPKGADVSSVFVGRPDAAHTKFEANIPYWKKPNFEPTQLQAGFLPKGKPELMLKATTLPADALPSSGKNPFNIIDKDVYQRFAQDQKSNLELIAATRQKFPNYDNFNPTEKEYAKRNVLYDNIKTLDQSQYHPTATTNTPRTNINIAGAKETQIKDVFQEIEGLVGSKKSGTTPVNELSPTAQRVVLDHAKAVYGNVPIVKIEDGKEVQETDSNGNLKFRPLTQADIVISNKDGKLGIYSVKKGTYNGKPYDAPDKLISPLDYYDVNARVNNTAKAKQEVIKREAVKGNSYTIKGKDYNHQDLIKMGYTDDQIQQALKLGTIKHK